METYFNSGWIDGFRALNPQPHAYTWWTFRANARANNKGWRIDYCALSETLNARLKESFIHPEAKHSDHCPTGILLG
jgi:exodeoxyribonuclease-3